MVAELAVEIFTHCSALIGEQDMIVMLASTVFSLFWWDFKVLCASLKTTNFNTTALQCIHEISSM